MECGSELGWHSSSPRCPSSDFRDEGGRRKDFPISAAEMLPKLPDIPHWMKDSRSLCDRTTILGCRCCESKDREEKSRDDFDRLWEDGVDVGDGADVGPAQDDREMERSETGNGSGSPPSSSV
jgi:hypothetical protein